MTPRKTNILLALGLTLLAAYLFADHLVSPFNRSFQGWNGAFYGMAARNFLRYGFMDLGFMHCLEAGAMVPNPEMYLRHPPLCSLLAALSVGIFGESEGTIRLPAYLLSVATVPLLYLWLQRMFQG